MHSHLNDNMQIADFHCDLLSFLEGNPEKTAYDPDSNASIPQMILGNVILQTLAVYTMTEKGSSRKGERQVEIFSKLLENCPEFTKDIRPVLAIENASGFCEEDEPLDVGLRRLESWLEKTKEIAYISLTWNDENRFGGGNATDIGLKADGRELLQWMEGKNIAIDLSHTSDKLADDILKRIKNVIPIASHSNFRGVTDHPRNLPDPIAREIGTKGGLIGLNVIREFVGESPKELLHHIEYADQLELLHILCLGADFFSDKILPPERIKPFFYPGFDNSSCYPKIVDLLSEKLPMDTVEQICFKNLTNFL